MPCVYCSRKIKNAGSLKAHEMSCKENPNRIQHKHSPLAGAKKGSVSWNKGKKIGLTAYHESIRIPDKEVFVENSTYARHNLKRRILNQNLIEYRCACCGVDAVWNGKPMPLILDHINGVNNDNRLENLRFVCSNCDSQLDTYKSKNRKGSQVVYGT